MGEFTLYSSYFWLITLIVAGFLLWFILGRSCIRVIRHCCCRKLTRVVTQAQLSYGFDEDFYKCISFTTLKAKLIHTQDALEKARMTRMAGKHQATELNRYIEILERRRSDIVARVDEIAETVLGKEKASHLKMIHDKLAALNKEDQKHPIGGAKIQSELQSYDLLQNEKYNRLEELKHVLDSVSYLKSNR